MTAKEYLGQAYRIDQRINSKIEQIRSLHELAAKATSTLSDAPRSASPNLQPMEDIIAKIVDLETEINRDVDALVDVKRDMVALIKQVENLEQQTLLELRYLCFKRWEQIAADMSYSIQHTFRLHEQAQKCVAYLAKMRVNVIE
jgi:hypothetical protein